MRRIRHSILLRICITALVMLALVAPGAHGADSLRFAQEDDTEITRTPRTGNTTDETAEDPQDEPASQPAGTYTGPVYGYSVEYDPDVWALDSEIQEGTVDGVRLFRDNSTFTIWAWDAYGSDPVACLDGESEYYSTQTAAISDWEPAIGQDGEPLRYESDNLAWGVFNLNYTYASGETSPLVDYISCEPIPGQDAVLIVLLSSNPGAYNTELDHALDVLDTLEFSDTEDASTEGQSADPTAIVEETAEATEITGVEIDTGLSGSLYKSPNYGYTAQIPLEWQILDESVEGGDERLVVGNGTSIVTLWATNQYAGDLAGCVDFAASASGLDLVLDRDSSGRAFRGVYRNEAFANFVYEEDGVPMMYFVNCRAIPGTDGYLILIQDVEYDQFTAERRFRTEIENSIVLPN